MAITWKTLAGPDFGQAATIMQQSNAALQNSFNTFAGIANTQANKMEEENTAKALNFLNQTVTDSTQARNVDLATLDKEYGGINQAAVQDALTRLTGDFSTAEKEEARYQDVKATEQQRIDTEQQIQQQQFYTTTSQDQKQFEDALLYDKETDQLQRQHDITMQTLQAKQTMDLENLRAVNTARAAAENRILNAREQMQDDQLVLVTDKANTDIKMLDRQVKDAKATLELNKQVDLAKAGELDPSFEFTDVLKDETTFINKFSASVNNLESHVYDGYGGISYFQDFREKLIEELPDINKLTGGRFEPNLLQAAMARIKNQDGTYNLNQLRDTVKALLPRYTVNEAIKAKRGKVLATYAEDKLFLASSLTSGIESIQSKYNDLSKKIIQVGSRDKTIDALESELKRKNNSVNPTKGNN